MGKYIDIITRSAWGNRYGIGWSFRSLPAQYVVLHHSAGATPSVNATLSQDIAAIRDLDQTGYDRFNYADKGWKRPAGAGISYTWAVAPSGRAFEGHDVARESSHTAGYNRTAVAICLVGNYENATVSEKQIDSVARVVLEAHSLGYIRTPKIDYGHRDLFQTACPGKNAYPLIDKINARIQEILKGNVAPAPKPVDPNKGFPVEYIKEIQSLLSILGYYNGTFDGKLPSVDAAVRKFQTDEKLEVDGLPGSQTRSRLEALVKAKEDAELLAKRIAEVRIAGSSRWDTASATALTVLPQGRGVLIAGDGLPDERYATARITRDGVIYLPVKPGAPNPPSATVNAIKRYRPEWIRVIGGPDRVPDDCVYTLLQAANLA